MAPACCKLPAPAAKAIPYHGAPTQNSSLGSARVLHEAEAATVTERHERVSVEIAQGAAGGSAPHLVYIGNRNTPVAPQAVERDQSRADERA